MSRPATALVSVWLVACAPALVSRPERGESEDLLELLPEPARLPGLTPAGEAEQAAGQELFGLINGGAELYLNHGFLRAVTQTYVSADATRFTLEIFQMQDEAGAEAIYTARGGSWGAAPAIGKASTFEGYYGLYLEGRYYFTVTASRSQGELGPPIEQLARAAAARMSEQR